MVMQNRTKPRTGIRSLGRERIITLPLEEQSLSSVEQSIKQKLITSKNKINTISLWNSIREDIKYEIKN